MQENTNKAIAINSLMLYVRLVIVSACGLLYTRFSLQALGVADYGLFSVIGGVISFVAIINTIMIATSNRFIAIAIGKKDSEEMRQTFNVNLVIHVCIAMATILLALPVGHWYIANNVNYAGDFSNVYMVYDIIVCASVFSFVGVPYNGLLLAKERFFVFCGTDVLSSVLKLVFTYLLIDHFEAKLLLYTLVTALMTAYPTVVFFGYCRRKFPEITKLSVEKDWRKYVDVLKFASSMSIGAIAYIAKAQGAALVVNMFFSTVMNGALAVANSVNAIVVMFANNIQRSIAPQIVKSYAANDTERYTTLVCMSSKMTYLVMLMVSIPFLIDPETVFGLWLGEVPEHTVVFTRLLIVDVLIMSLNAGVPDLVFATGKVRRYQIVVNGLTCMSVVVGFFALKSGMPSTMLFVSYIVFSSLVFVMRPVLLKHVARFRVSCLVRDAYLPSMLVTMLVLPVAFLKPHLDGVALIVVAVAYYCIVVWSVGLKRQERRYVVSMVRRQLPSSVSRCR